MHNMTIWNDLSAFLYIIAAKKIDLRTLPVLTTHTSLQTRHCYCYTLFQYKWLHCCRARQIKAASNRCVINLITDTWILQLVIRSHILYSQFDHPLVLQDARPVSVGHRQHTTSVRLSDQSSRERQEHSTDPAGASAILLHVSASQSRHVAAAAGAHDWTQAGNTAAAAAAAAAAPWAQLDRCHAGSTAVAPPSSK